MYMTGRGVQQDYTAAAIWFRKASEQGYAFAQSNLGTLHRDGRGVPENDAEAVVWFRKAADQGDPVAQFLLGGQYATGQGVARDYAEALLWFQKAAEQGHPAARFYLGVMYAKGDGVPQDYVRAHMWFSLSAAQGNQEAVKTLEMAERKMTPAQIVEAQKLAKWLKPSIKARDWPRTMPARVLPASSVRARVALVVRSELGQTKTNSVRAYVFRLCPLKLGHRSAHSGCLKGAKAEVTYLFHQDRTSDIRDESRFEPRSDLHAGYPLSFRGGIGKCSALSAHSAIMNFATESLRKLFRIAR
jgi:hypothetical protein